MPPIVTANATILCAHGGRVTLVPKQFTTQTILKAYEQGLMLSLTAMEARKVEADLALEAGDWSGVHFCQVEFDGLLPITTACAFYPEFDWVGTRDPSPWLAAPEAIAMMRELGLEAVRDWNHAFVLDATRRLVEVAGAEPTAPESMTGTMTTVRLPARFGTTIDDAAGLRDALLFEDRVEVQLHSWRNRLWVRVSGQIYNDGDDLERLVHGLAARCHA